MNMKKTILLILFLFLIPSFVSAAIEIELDVKSQFSSGETVKFNYSINSDVGQEISFFASVRCPNAPVPFIGQEIVTLKPSTPYRGFYSGISIDYSIESQNCAAFVQVLEPTLAEEEKNFSIITPPSFSFDIKTCKDMVCVEESKVFLLNENIYIDYISEVAEPVIAAILALPDQTIQQLTIPTSIKATQIGTYELDITASKQDYKTITKKEQFGVIEEEADILFVGVCNANGKCESGENYQNCPQDCLITEPKTNIIIIILLLLIAVVLMSFITYRIIASRKEQILEIRKYIEDNLAKGYSRRQIRDELIRDRWSERLIDHCFRTLLKAPAELTKEQLLELQNYIINTEKQGYTEDQIKAELIRDGWTEKQIETAFEKLKG